MVAIFYAPLKDCRETLEISKIITSYQVLYRSVLLKLTIYLQWSYFVADITSLSHGILSRFLNSAFRARILKFRIFLTTEIHHCKSLFEPYVEPGLSNHTPHQSALVFHILQHQRFVGRAPYCLKTPIVLNLACLTAVQIRVRQSMVPILLQAIILTKHGHHQVKTRLQRRYREQRLMFRHNQHTGCHFYRTCRSMQIRPSVIKRLSCLPSNMRSQYSLLSIVFDLWA